MNNNYRASHNVSVCVTSISSCSNYKQATFLILNYYVDLDCNSYSQKIVAMERSNHVMKKCHGKVDDTM